MQRRDRPLFKSDGAGFFESISAGEAASLIEVVLHGRMDGGEFRKTSYAPEALKGPFSSSKRQVRILNRLLSHLPFCCFSVAPYSQTAAQ